jgi:phosphate starvation-inducible membrane PsiE
MVEAEGGGAKVLRGLLIAALIVIGLVLLVVFWRQVLDAGEATFNYISERFPAEAGQQAAVIIYLVVAGILGILFSKAGHFTAYGIAIGLGTLLWFLFWEGFPAIGLSPSWAESAGLGHLPPSIVTLWAVVGAAIITLVFVPLELWEKFRKRRRSLSSEQ